MTEKEWTDIRVMMSLFQNIEDATNERDVKTSLKYHLMGLTEEGIISAFNLVKNGDVLVVDVPSMFTFEFNEKAKALTIQSMSDVIASSVSACNAWAEKMGYIPGRAAYNQRKRVGKGSRPRCIKDMDVQVDVGVYPGEERGKNDEEMPI